MTADVIPGTCRRCWPACLAYHCQFVEGEEVKARGPGWGTGEEKPQDAEVSKPAANNSLHQPANRAGAQGRWVAPVSWSKSVLGCAQRLPQTWTPLYLSLASPGTVVSLVLRKRFVGVLPGPSRFGMAFTALALPRLPHTVSDYLQI